MRTKSEALFDEYCRRRGYRSEPIEAGPDFGKTPDRLVTTESGRLVVEIKELTPNEQDLREARELQEQGWTSGGGVPGSRVFGHIKKAAPQLKRFADRSLPCVLVLFDNIVVEGLRPRAGCIHLDPSFIDFGMYGLETVVLGQGSEAPTDRLVHIADGRGGRRQMTEDARAYISAVAVLREEPESAEPFLLTYHNYFGRVPLSATELRGPLDHHFRKPSHPDHCPQTWEEIPVGGAG